MGLLRIGLDLSSLLDGVLGDTIPVLEDPSDRADRRRAERTARHHLAGRGGRQLVAMLDRVHAGEHRGADAIRADRVRGHREVPLMRFTDAGLELVRREGAERRRDAWGEDAACRDQFDRRRAVADLLAHGGPDRVGSVDLPGERDVVAVAAGDGERTTGREDPGSRDEAGGHGPRDVDARAAHPPRSRTEVTPASRFRFAFTTALIAA